MISGKKYYMANKTISFLNMEIFNEPDNENFQKNIDKLNKSDYIVISNATGKARGRLSRIIHILKKFNVSTPLHEDWGLPAIQTISLTDEIQYYWIERNYSKNSKELKISVVDVDVNHRIYKG